MDYDEDYVIPLTRIEFDKRQRKNLKIGFIWLGACGLMGIWVVVWFFST